MIRRVSARAVTVLGGCVLAACATRADVRRLHDEIAQLRQAQVEAAGEARRRDAALLDSLARLQTQLQDLRGTLLARLTQIDRQLLQLQELSGQNQQRLAELRERLRAAETPPTPPPTPSDTARAATPTDLDALYRTAVESWQRGSLAAARAGFEDLLARDPNGARAPDALLYLAEIAASERKTDEALRRYDEILVRFPRSPRAATALYRSAQLELQQGRVAQARGRFERLLREYPSSPEAAGARRQLERLPRGNSPATPR